MPAARPQCLSHPASHPFSYYLIPALLLASLSALLAPRLLAANNPVPYIDLISPVSVNPGTTGVTLTVLGTGFVSTSVVKWNGTALTTTYISAKKLTATIPNSLDAAVGLGSITVVSPTPGGGTSDVFYLPVAAHESSTTFPSAPSSSVSVGNTPQGITTADLNGDGKLDLAVANQTDGTVSILLGNGNGTFTTKSTPSAGGGANWVAIGDFNEDGIPDLAVANQADGTVSILRGVGNGTFTAGAVLTAGDSPFAIITADFNRDGHLDLAVSNSSDNTITVFLGTGTGSFGSGSTYAVGNGPQVLVAGDFNEDGILDLAVSNEDDNTVSVLLGTGTGTFGTQSVISTGGSGYPIGLIAADFNGDNHLDLAAVNASDVAILLGSGTGSFTLHSDPSTGSGDLIAGVAGDYNGDGNLDLVVSDQDAGEAFLLLGNGNGTFGSAVTYTTASGAFGVATADFNGDGALDLAVANGNANNVSIFLQRLPVSLSPTSLAFGNQAVGVPSSPAMTVSLTNDSGSTLNISSIAFTGTDGGDFSSGGTCSTSSPVTNNSTCTITVTFTPGAAGARSATLAVTDGAGNSPQTLGLTGTGTSLPPSLATSFGASSISLNGTTSLTFTITNPNTASPLSGVAFTDSLPAGLLVATPNGLSGTCGSGGILATAGSSSISLSGGTLAANGSCVFSVNVTGTTAGAKNNSVSVTSTEGGTGNTSNASVTVIAPPTISISFSPTSIPLSGGDSSLTFVITNPNASSSLSNIAFSDTLPAGLTVASTPNVGSNCGGTVTAAANGTVISLSGASIGSAGNCNVDVHVTGIAAGTQADTTGTISSTEGGTGTTSNTADLAVVAPPSITKSFGASAIALNASTSLTFTITNPSANTASLTGVAFTDSLPSGIVVATPNGLSNSCGGTATAVAASGSVSLSGSTIAASSNCTLAVNITGTTAGSFTNVTGSVSSTNGGTGNTASANLTVAAPATITKSFGAATIPLNGATSLSFTMSNPNSSSSLSGLAFTDSLPAGLAVSTPSNLSSTCIGTATAVAGAGSVSLSGGTLAASASCSVSVNVKGSTAGIKNNSVSISSAEGGAGNTSNASITVVVPPSLAEVFGAASIPLNGSTSLTFTVSNPNSTITLTGVGLSDTLPAGLVVATPNGLAGTCGGGTITAVAGSSTLSLSGATISANAGCNFAVNVTGVAAGSQNNTTGAGTSNEGGSGSSTSASVVVEAPPSIAVSFGSANVALDGTTSLTLTFTNPAANTQSLTGVAVTDTLPSGIVVATPNGVANSCGGTATAVAGSGSLSLTGGAIATSSNCVLSINVTGTASGSYTNVTGNVSSTNGGAGNTASANLAVASPPNITKTFGAATIPLNGTTSLSFSITNPVANSISLTGVAFADSLPAGLLVATPNALIGSCGGGTITATAGSSSVSLSGATLAANSSCTFSVNVTGATSGTKNNSVAVTSTTAGTGNTSNASITVLSPPTLSKSFGAASIPLNGSTSLTFTASNPNTSTTLTGISFTDSLPAGLVIATPNGLIGSCDGGTITATAGNSVVTLSGASLAFSASCNFSVSVTGTSAGTKSNTTGAVTSTEGGTGGTASANLAVEAPPSIAKSFGASSIAPNGTTSLTFTLTNPSANSQALTGVAFTDAFPSGLVVATPSALANSCGGTATAVAASASVSLASATIAASSNCTLTLNVTATAAGSITNVTGAVTSANGGTGNTASANLSTGAPPAITSAATATFVVGVASSFTITTTGSPLPSISLSGALPAGLTFTDNGNGTATISGTPLASSTVGNFPFTIVAHNGSGADASQSFSLTLNKGVPTLTWPAPTSITYGAALTSTQLDATASVPGTFVYTPASGATLGAGSQSLSVLFTPTDAADYTAASANVSITVNKATPTITWPVPAEILYGAALTSTQLDATASVPGVFVYTPAVGALLSAGAQTLSVVFTPTDAANNNNASAQVSLTVNPASTTTALSASAASANPGSSVTLTATVSSSAGTPSGSISFFDGTTSLASLALASGTASFSTSSLAAGVHSLTASYSGSANFASSVSSAFSENITTPDFSLAATLPPPTPSGQNIDVPITVNPLGGISGQVQFTVTGLPPRSSAAFSPPVLTLGATPAFDTLVVLTTPRFNYLSERAVPNSRPVFAGILWFPFAGLFVGGAGFALRRNRKGAACLLLLVLLVGSGLLSGCASMGAFQNTGTPAGTYPLTVTASVTTASGTTTHSTVVTIIVR